MTHQNLPWPLYRQNIEHSGDKVIKLMGFTSDLKREDQFQAERKYLAEEHKVVVTDFLVEHFIHCQR